MYALFQKSRRGSRRHALDALELRHQLIPYVGTDLRIIHPVHAHGRDHDGQHVGIELHDHGIAHGIIPVCLDLIQLLTDLQRDGIHVGRLRELQDDHGIVLRRHGLNGFNIAHRRHARFHRLRHHGLHRLRTGARIGSHDDHIGQTDIGQKIRGSLHEGHNAQHDGQHHAHQHGIWFSHAKT